MNRFEKPSPVVPGVLQQILSPFLCSFSHWLKSLSYPNPSSQCQSVGWFGWPVLREHFSRTPYIWMAKARFPLDLPFNWSNWTSSTLSALSPNLLCENPVSWCFLWVFNLSHPITSYHQKNLHDIHPGYGLQWPIKQKCEQCTPCRVRGCPDALGEFFHPWPW